MHEVLTKIIFKNIMSHEIKYFDYEMNLKVLLTVTTSKYWRNFKLTDLVLNTFDTSRKYMSVSLKKFLIWV